MATDFSHLIPFELRETELFKFVQYLIGFAEDSEVVPTGTELFDSLITKVFTQYRSEEAVLAYFNLCIKPQLGTHNSLETLLRIVGIVGSITEWYNTGDVAFEFGVDIVSAPPDLDYAKFVELIYLIKNERSWLIALHKLACMGGMIWDQSFWDESAWEVPHSAEIGYYDVIEINYP